MFLYRIKSILLKPLNKGFGDTLTPCYLEKNILKVSEKMNHLHLFKTIPEDPGYSTSNTAS